MTALHIKLRATGGNKTKTPGPGAQSALRALSRSGLKIGRIGAPKPDPARPTRGLQDPHPPSVFPRARRCTPSVAEVTTSYCCSLFSLYVQALFLQPFVAVEHC